MTIFRFSIALFASIFLLPSFASALQSQARNHVEAMLFLEVDAAKQSLDKWIKAHPEGESAIAQELLNAGFMPDNGSPNCRFYSYYRKTGEAGSARTASIALCDAPLNPMVLVLDMLPYAKRNWTGQLMEKKDQK